MKNLYYQTSYGVGNLVMKDGVFPCNHDYPEDLQKEGENEFTIYTFGHDINPEDAKSPLFRCRDLIATIHGTYIGKRRELLRACHYETACTLADECFSSVKELVVVDMCVDESTDKENLRSLYSNLYRIVTAEVKKQYKVSEDIVIGLFVNNDELRLIKELKEWGSARTIYEDDGFILLFL